MSATNNEDYIYYGKIIENDKQIGKIFGTDFMQTTIDVDKYLLEYIQRKFPDATNEDIIIDLQLYYDESYYKTVRFEVHEDYFEYIDFEFHKVSLDEVDVEF